MTGIVSLASTIVLWAVVIAILAIMIRDKYKEHARIRRLQENARKRAKTPKEYYTHFDLAATDMRRERDDIPCDVSVMPK